MYKIKIIQELKPDDCLNSEPQIVCCWLGLEMASISKTN